MRAIATDRCVYDTARREAIGSATSACPPEYRPFLSDADPSSVASSGPSAEGARPGSAETTDPCA